MGKSKRDTPYEGAEPRDSDDLDLPSSSSAAIPLLPTEHTTAAPSFADHSLPSYYEATSVPIVNHASTTGNNPEAPPSFSEYFPEVHEGSSGSVVSYDTHLNNEPEALYQFLIQQNRRKPVITAHIVGSHTETKRNGDKTETRTVTDFQLDLDLSQNIIPKGGEASPGFFHIVDPREKVYRGGRFRRRGSEIRSDGTEALRVGKKNIRNWVEDYCAHKSSTKEFTMTKTCPGYDYNKLQQRLKELVRSTNYRGNIGVSFPITHHKVHVRPDNKITRLRYNKFVRWFFYLTFLWIISWPVLWLITYRYDLVRSEWPLSVTAEDGTKQYVIDEDSWFERWREAIRRSVINRRRGWVTEQEFNANVVGQVLGGMRNPFRFGQQAAFARTWGDDEEDTW